MRSREFRGKSRRSVSLYLWRGQRALMGHCRGARSILGGWLAKICIIVLVLCAIRGRLAFWAHEEIWSWIGYVINGSSCHEEYMRHVS